MEKGPDAFRTISEVAEDLDLPQHVLRFWETRFSQIKPLKRGGGRRYYRPDDVDLLRGIRHLLYGDGYTIRGVQQILREQGVRHVQSIGRAAETEDPRSTPAEVDTGHPGVGREEAPIGRSGDSATGLADLLPPLRAPARAAPELPRSVDMSAPQRPVPPATGAEDDIPPLLFRRSAPAAYDAERHARPAMRPVLDEELDGRTQPSAPRVAPDSVRLSNESIRLLKATLFELGECRRLLDTAAREPES